MGTTRAEDCQGQQPEREYLVSIRPEVIDATGHWLGNLLQRLRAIEQGLERDASSLAEPLKRTVDDLERLSRCLLDYLADTPAGLELFHAREVLATIVLTLDRSYRPEPSAGELAECDFELLVNPVALETAVRYLPALLSEDGVPVGAVVVVHAATEGDRFVIGLSAEKSNPRRSAAGELYHAVMEKYLVGQGGGFWSNASYRGGREWFLCLSRACLSQTEN